MRFIALQFRARSPFFFTVRESVPFLFHILAGIPLLEGFYDCFCEPLEDMLCPCVARKETEQIHECLAQIMVAAGGPGDGSRLYKSSALPHGKDLPMPSVNTTTRTGGLPRHRSAASTTLGVNSSAQHLPRVSLPPESVTCTPAQSARPSVAGENETKQMHLMNAVTDYESTEDNTRPPVLAVINTGRPLDDKEAGKNIPKLPTSIISSDDKSPMSMASSNDMDGMEFVAYDYDEGEDTIISADATPTFIKLAKAADGPHLPNLPTPTGGDEPTNFARSRTDPTGRTSARPSKQLQLEGTTESPRVRTSVLQTNFAANILGNIKEDQKMRGGASQLPFMAPKSNSNNRPTLGISNSLPLKKRKGGPSEGEVLKGEDFRKMATKFLNVMDIRILPSNNDPSTPQGESEAAAHLERLTKRHRKKLRRIASKRGAVGRLQIGIALSPIVESGASSPKTPKSMSKSNHAPEGSLSRVASFRDKMSGFARTFSDRVGSTFGFTGKNASKNRDVHHLSAIVDTSMRKIGSEESKSNESIGVGVPTPRKKIKVKVTPDSNSQNGDSEDGEVAIRFVEMESDKSSNNTYGEEKEKEKEKEKE